MSSEQNPAQAAAPAGTDALKQHLVESLMAVIAGPDDPGAARAADDAVRALDARLADQAGTV